MKKRNLIACVIAMVLIAALGIGATLAYLTDNDTAKNTFTAGKVKIDLVEPSWDEDKAQDLEPGDVIDKDPAIVNTGKNDAYMMIKVEGVKAMRDKDFEVYFDDVNWVLVDKVGKALTPTMVDKADSETGEEEAQLVDGYYVYVGDTEGVVKAGKATSPLFTKVYYTKKATGSDLGSYIVKGRLNDDEDGVSHYEIWEATADKAMELKDGKVNNFKSYDAAADYIVAEDGLNAVGTTYTFDMDITGYSIQSENVTFVTNDVYGWVAIVIE